MHASIIVSGIVQGVGFRPFVYRIARKHNVKGFVRNRADAVVEIAVEGSKSQLDGFLTSLKNELPPLARLDSVDVQYTEDEAGYSDFVIQTSSQERVRSGSIIPPDIAVCDDCLRELRLPNDRRFGYFFITCTNCGPRFTTITSVPYDRPNTTMRQFPMCASCREEYTSPIDRRFHAQTIACEECGPKVALLDRHGTTLKVGDPIREAARLLSAGNVLAIKGNGGFHLAAPTLQDEPISRLRRSKEREFKPFAIMGRDLKSVQEFAEVHPCERQLLESYIRPIVLLHKKNPFTLSSLISPGLDTVGVMLPYTGLHYLLFDSVREPALIMTSANAPNEPIIIDNDVAVGRLGGIVDYFLVHNRDIAQRADDSVLRCIGMFATPTRRSRGYAPAPILLRDSVRLRSLGLGPELNATACMILDNKAYLTQHIGDTETMETAQFLENSVEHLERIIGFKAEAIACDLHPKFTTTKIAQRMAQELEIPLKQIQHHHAHAGSLMAEHGLREIIAIVCDGFGLGVDGRAWGGEILVCRGGQFSRSAHLEEQPMVGGDLATRFPARMVVGILRDEPSIQQWLTENAEHLPHGKEEADLILRQLNRKDFMWTTSCGRVLDSISTILGLCYERSYEGEPAMKLEAHSSQGQNTLNLQSEFDGTRIGTTRLVRAIYENRNRMKSQDLAFSAQAYVGKVLADAAIQLARREGIRTVGFSGGVALNEHISLTIRRTVLDSGLDFVCNSAVPPGDGGVSFGQAYLASMEEG